MAHLPSLSLSCGSRNLKAQLFPGFPAMLLAAIAAFVLSVQSLASGAGSRSSEPQVAAPATEAPAGYADPESRSAGHSHDREACRTGPGEENPFRRASAPGERSRISAVKSGPPAPPRAAAYSAALPADPPAILVVPSRCGAPRCVRAYPCRYPVFLFADLPPPPSA